MNENRFLSLIQATLEGTITDTQRSELHDWLEQNPAALDRYLEHCQMEAWLRDPSLKQEPEAEKIIPLNFDQQGVESPKPRHSSEFFRNLFALSWS